VIVVFSPTTAHEVILGLERLRPGTVHRAGRAVERVGGKGVNVARMCGRMGVAVRLVAVVDERAAGSLAAEPDLAGAEIRLIASGVSARTDVIAVEAGGRATVLNGTAPGPAPSVIDEAVRRLLDGLVANDLLVLTGSLPVGTPAELYARLVAAARQRGATSLVDASGVWLREALPSAPDVVKVSADELAAARVSTAARAWADGRSLAPEPHALVVTAGARGARAWSGGEGWTVAAPRQAAVNPIGAGDAVCAGLAAGLAARGPLVGALADGVAWAAAKVRDFDLALDPAFARRVRPSVVIRAR
jgi:tagatose 6-phosphate kinase